MRFSTSLLLAIIILIFFTVSPREALSAPRIRNITTSQNAALYEKFEITFDVDTVAKNFYWPYDTNPPQGITPKEGVSVDVHFTPDNWNTVFTQPAFYYQNFLNDPNKSANNDWLYPTANFTWKARFSPHKLGTWKFKIEATDASGQTESAEQTFSVASSTNHGFIKVSEDDPRYFEYDDGTYFPALGYNLNYRRVDWINPIKANKSTFENLKENNIQLIRTWLSQWSIFGSAWSPWRNHNPNLQFQEPDARIRHETAPPFNHDPNAPLTLARQDSEVFLWLAHDERVFNDGKQWNFVPCAVLGWEAAPLPAKRNTNYRIKVRYKSKGIRGPKVSGKPFGFTVKFANWLWGNSERDRCYYPGTGNLVAATYDGGNWRTYQDPQYSDWTILEGTFKNSDSDFFEKMYLTIENANEGEVYVDYVWLQEQTASGYGPNLVYKPWMAQHKYINQRNAYAFDQVLSLAEETAVYIKPVILEKQDYVLRIFEWEDGKLSTYEPHKNPRDLFFGNGRELSGETKVRWLEKTWWRYLQARWGYSPNIHSWELLNEGNPNQSLHHILVDEMGKYFQTEFVPQGQTEKHPNAHMVSTSFWSSFPTKFWKSSSYPFVDYADVHQYARPSNLSPLDYIYDPSDYYDAALFSQKLSMYHGALQQGGAGKPVIRGETGWTFSGTDVFANNQTNGTWLHNFIWAGINPGGLIESYWVGSPTDKHIYLSGSHDHRPMFKNYYNFIKDVPLNNGNYQDAAAQSNNSNIRAWGQKDLVGGRAHLWIQNKNHTWKNVLDNKNISPISTTITLRGFQPNTSYPLERWNTYQGKIASTGQVRSNGSGTIQIDVSNLTTDFAVRIGNYTNQQNPKSFIFQYNDFVVSIGNTLPQGENHPLDFDNDFNIDILDYDRLIGR